MAPPGRKREAAAAEAAATAPVMGKGAKKERRAA